MEIVPDPSGETWWCTVHKREATFIWHGKHVCDPNLGGILMPCFTEKKEE